MRFKTLFLTLLFMFTIQSVLFAFSDSDGDMIDDQWEVEHLLNPNNASDADLDPDGDRLTNRDEFYAMTDPHFFDDAETLAESKMLRLFKGKAFLYFWEQSRGPYYFTSDNAHYDQINNPNASFQSIATTGFSLMAYAIAIENDWVDKKAVYDRVKSLLLRCRELQSPQYDGLTNSIEAGNVAGHLYHFVNDEGVQFNSDVEVSTVDHAFLLAGALVIGEYFKGTEIENLAADLYLNTNFAWFYDGMFLRQAWKGDANGYFDDYWNRYSELLTLLTLAMGHPDPQMGIPETAWDNLTFGTGNLFDYEYAHLVLSQNEISTGHREPINFGFVSHMPNTLDVPGFQNDDDEVHFLFAGSLHNHQYSHMFNDFRKRKEKYGTDFFANSVSATLSNRQYAVNLNHFNYGGDPASNDPTLQFPYETYGPNSWGIMAGLTSRGYDVMQPEVKGNNFAPYHLAWLNDDGTVALNAPLGSVPFAPREILDYTRNMLVKYQDQIFGYDALIGRYGFRNAFNLGRTSSGQVGHFPVETIGLDLGPVMGNIENRDSGLIWKLTMQNIFIKNGMEKAGFPTEDVYPTILNFDGDLDLPHLNQGLGGQDPNAFGGGSFAFGSSEVNYDWIGDVGFIGRNKPKDWAIRLDTFGGNDSGAFLSLLNQSVSNKDYLSFWIKGEKGNEKFLVGLKDSVTDLLGRPVEAKEVKLAIDDFLPTGAVSTAWQKVIIPLSSFLHEGLRLTRLDNISFTASHFDNQTIWLDHIEFEDDIYSPKAPTSLVGEKINDLVKLTWQSSSSSDVMAYRIYRSLGQGGTYQLLDTVPFSENGYTDDVSVYLNQIFQFNYYVVAVDGSLHQNRSAPSNVVDICFAQPASPPKVKIKEPGYTVQEGGFWFKGKAKDPDGVQQVRVYLFNLSHFPFIMAMNQTASYDQTTKKWRYFIEESKYKKGDRLLLFVRAQDTTGIWSKWKSRYVKVI